MPEGNAALAATPWAEWAVTPIAADASARQYARLTGPDGQTAILMNSGPVPLPPFTAIARYLRQGGLQAPKILWENPPFLVLEDLGQADFVAAIESGGNPEELYRAAIDVLVRLRDLAPPGLAKLTPDVAGEMVRITADHYAPAADADVLAGAVTSTMERYAPKATTIALRDFHAENLIWRPDYNGTDRVGILDFQDALIAPEGYDLASLLRDVRRDVAPDLVETGLQYYCARTGADPIRFKPSVCCLGAQRNLRILGVFARLIRAEGKAKYRPLIRRVWNMLLADLDHPELGELRHVVLTQLPNPEDAGFAG